MKPGGVRGRVMVRMQEREGGGGVPSVRAPLPKGRVMVRMPSASRRAC